MKKTTINKCLLAGAILFEILGVVFLGLSIFTEPKNNTYLTIALAGIVIANSLSLIRNCRIKKQKQEEQ